MKKMPLSAFVKINWCFCLRKYCVFKYNVFYIGAPTSRLGGGPQPPRAGPGCIRPWFKTAFAPLWKLGPKSKIFQKIWRQELNSDWLINSFNDGSFGGMALTLHKSQRSARIRAGSDWTGLKLILDGSGLDRTAIFLKIGGSDWENFCCFNVIIQNISNILVVIRFYRFAKWQCIFFYQWQKLSCDFFAIRTVFTFAHMKRSVLVATWT